LRQGHDEQAELILRRAAERAQAIRSADLEAAAILNLGYLRLNRRRFDEAVPYFEEASSLTGPQAAVYWAAQQNLLACANSLGEYDDAVRIAQASIARLRHSGATVLFANALGELGRTLLLKGELRQAVPYLEQALAGTIATRGTRNAAVWASNLAAAYIELNDWNQAETFNQKSIEIRRSVTPPLLYFNELNAGQIAIGRKDYAAARRHLERAMTDGKG